MAKVPFFGLVLGAALGLSAATARGQGGTDCCQVLQLPAAAFVPKSSTTQYEYLPPGYVYLTSPGTQATNQLWAPVTLPSGARIQSFGLTFYDADASNDVSATLRAFTHGTPDTGSPSFFDVVSAASTGCCGTGYASVAADHTIRNDAAHDPNASQYVVVVNLPAATSDLALKGVDVRWQRQVSPAPGAATFNDVPASDPGFSYIEALVASGVTAGCGGGSYCPDAPLTRRQMAVFLAKALGLHWPS